MQTTEFGTSFTSLPPRLECVVEILEADVILAERHQSAKMYTVIDLPYFGILMPRDFSSTAQSGHESRAKLYTSIPGAMPRSWHVLHHMKFYSTISKEVSPS